MRTRVRDVARRPTTPLLLGGFSGTLSGRDRAGVVAFTGTGPVRYLPAQNARINLVKNPSFEVNTTGYAVRSGGAISRIATDGVFGTACLQASGSATADGFQCSGPAALGLVRTPSVPHTFSFWAKYVSGESGWMAHVRARDAAGTGIGGNLVNLPFTPSGAWQRFALTTTPSAGGVGASMLDIVIDRQGGGGGAAVALFDGFQCEEGAAASAYFDGTTPGACWLDPLTGQLGTAHASPSVSAAAVLVEEATTNLLANPSTEVDTTNQGLAGSGTISRDTTYAFFGAASTKAVTPGAIVSEGVQFLSLPGLGIAGGQTYSASAWVRGGGTVRLQMQITYSDASSDLSTQAVATLTDQWQRVVVPPFTTNAAKTANRFILNVVTAGPAQATTFWVDAAQVEAKAYATTYCDGSLGTGYSWAGTAHASASSRAATTVKIGPESAYVSSAGQGSWVAWARRDAATGGGQRFLQVGNTVAGKDRIALFCFSDGLIYQSFDPNGVGFNVASGPPLAVGQWVCAAGAWSPLAMAVAVGGGAPVAAAHPAPVGDVDTTGDVGVGQYLATTYLDGPIGPVAVYDRPLTAHERAQILAAGPALAFDGVARILPL